MQCYVKPLSYQRPDAAGCLQRESVKACKHGQASTKHTGAHKINILISVSGMLYVSVLRTQLHNIHKYRMSWLFSSC